MNGKEKVKRQFGPRAEFGPKTDSDQIYKFGPNLYIRTKFIYSDQGLQANYRGNLVRIYIFDPNLALVRICILVRICLWSELS